MKFALLHIKCKDHILEPYLLLEMFNLIMVRLCTIVLLFSLCYPFLITMLSWLLLFFCNFFYTLFKRLKSMLPTCIQSHFTTIVNELTFFFSNLNLLFNFLAQIAQG